MKYQPVERAHVVPRTYLRNFADDEQMIGMRLVDQPEAETRISIEDAAVRKRFYRRTRPDGTPIDDVEHALGKIEQRAGPILRRIEESWPLSLDDKRVLGEFFALQVLRSPRWRTTYEWRSRLFAEDYRKSGRFDREVAETGLTPDEVVERTHELFDSDSFRLHRMLGMSSKASSIFGSMVWALVRFSRPMLATSDHPIFGWSLFEATSRPQPTPEGLGLINLLEVRVPVSSRSAILMTWLDRAGDIAVPFEGGRQQARNLNAFTIAQAEKQWFHAPGANPSYGKRRAYRALSAELLPGYGVDAASHSLIRRTVSERVNSQLGEERDEYEIVQINEGAPLRSPRATGGDD
jgi:hypothetical protein